MSGNVRYAERMLGVLSWATALGVPVVLCVLMAFLLWRGLPGGRSGCSSATRRRSPRCWTERRCSTDCGRRVSGRWPWSRWPRLSLSRSALPVGSISPSTPADDPDKCFPSVSICLRVSRPSSWGCSGLPDPVAAQNRRARGQHRPAALRVVPGFAGTALFDQHHAPVDGESATL